MEEDEHVRKLVELIFTKKCTATSVKKPPYSYLPASLKTNDFWWRTRYVLFMRQFTIKRKYEDSFDSSRCSSLSSYRDYLFSLMESCSHEHDCNPNVFDSFISVCCVVGFYNSETLRNARVNFCHLNSDIFMVFYHDVLRKTFKRRGGLGRLVEYIRHHKYLEWKWDTISLVSPDGSSSPVNDETTRKLQKELDLESKFMKFCSSAVSMLESFTMADKVISISSAELPTLPSREELIPIMVASRKSKIAEAGEDIDRFKIAAELKAIEEIRKGFPSSNSDSATKNVAEAIEDSARYENIIQAVIAHNRSRTSVHVNTNDSIEKKANGILDHLKDTFKTIIEVLDKCDKE